MSNRCWIKGPSTVLLLSAGLACAQDRAATGGSNLYVGGAIGRGIYDTDFQRTNALIGSTGATAFSSTANSADTMWKAYVGYRIWPQFAVEAGYWDFGKLNVATNISAPVATTMQRNFRANGYGADAIVYLPAYRDWTALLRAGALRTTAKASSGEPGGGLASLPTESASKFSAHWGLGLEYRLTPAAAARLDYENVRKVGDEAKFGSTDINVLTIGANYRF